MLVAKFHSLNAMDPVRFSPFRPGLTEIGRASAQAGKASDSGFVGAFKDALNAVNASQQEAAALSKQFQAGSEGVSLEETMIAMQKANISFQALVQVRNRAISAYHDIMNMQV
jgi:flagellar hook-basal body complex protein FliE